MMKKKNKMNQKNQNLMKREILLKRKKFIKWLDTEKEFNFMVQKKVNFFVNMKVIGIEILNMEKENVLIQMDHGIGEN